MFGKRWLRNSVSNFLTIDRIAEYRKLSRPVCIAAAGPSLEDSLQGIARHRHCFELWATSSALSAFAHRDIWPDLIIITEGGYYAREHLNAARGRTIPVAAPLTAITGLWRWPIVLLDQNFGIEQTMARFLSSHCANLPANGTVAGVAFHLAISLSAPAIIYAGLDLSIDSAATHARPHAFDRYGWDGEDHLHPQETERFLFKKSETRSRLGQYAQWFKTAIAHSPVPVYRLHPSSVDIGARPITISDAASITRASKRASPISSPAARLPSAPRAAAEWRAAPPLEKRLTLLRNIAEHCRGRYSASGTRLRRDATIRDMAMALNMPVWLRLSRSESNTSKQAELRETLLKDIDKFLDQFLLAYDDLKV